LNDHLYDLSAIYTVTPKILLILSFIL